MARCPSCGEPVSQFAAGCAICGADLEVARRQASVRRARLPRASLPRSPALPSLGDGAGTVLAVALLAAAFPFLGLLVAVFAANALALSSQRWARIALWILAAVALTLALVPSTRFGVIWRL